MRVLVLTVLLALLAAPAAQARPPARALLAGCERSLEETERAGVFEGQMSAVPGATRMQMRFTLQARMAERRRWRRVDALGFGTWLSAAPGISRWIYTKRVENLLAPASYRVQIRFRWLDAGGAVRLRAKRSSGRCRQPDPRADLAVRTVAVEPVMGDPERSHYMARVRNTGRMEAESSLLALTVGGVPLAAQDVPALEPGESAYVSVEGPACAAGTEIVADADAEESVDESDEADNRFTRSCPAAASS